MSASTSTDRQISTPPEEQPEIDAPITSDENHHPANENPEVSSPTENLDEAGTPQKPPIEPTDTTGTASSKGGYVRPTSRAVPVSPKKSVPSSPLREKEQQRRRSARRPSLDGNASVGSYQSNSSRSLMSSGGPSLSRPTGMRERMQQRLQTAQSERHLHTNNHHGGRNLQDNDDQSMRSVSSRSSRRSMGMPSSSVRDRLSTSWSKVPSIRRIVETTSGGDSGDDTLLLQLTQKVRQLEAERSRLVEAQEEMQKEHTTKVERLQNRLKEEKQNANQVGTESSTSKQRPSSPNAASTMLELQGKLDREMAKVSRLEHEQSRRDDLEEKYEDAQVAIANLRLQSTTTTPVRRLSGGSGGTAPSLISDNNTARRVSISEHREDERMHHEDERQQQVDDEQRKAESPPSIIDQQSRARTGSIDTTTTCDSELMVDGEQQIRTDKLQKLKEFRRSRESQLKELVLDSQNSPTDVQSVIRNLQDELKAAKQVMDQQKLQLQEQQDTIQSQEESLTGDSSPTPDDDDSKDTEVSTWKEKYRSLQRKYTKLEMDRAWGEFQLRDRITNDALKFHRRLRHWKEQTQELQRQLEDTMEHQAKETKQLRIRLSRQEEVAVAAEQDLIEYKRGTEQTLKEFGATQDRLAKATAQLAKYMPEPSGESSDPVMQQAQFLESAKERKEQEKQAWSTTGWLGKIRHRVGDADPSMMG
jgi:hypothetical protein